MIRPTALLALAAASLAPARAVIDAGLQPADLARLYQNVAAAEIAEADPGSGKIALRVGAVFKGAWKPGLAIALRASDPVKIEMGARAALRQGHPAVLFAGKGRGSRAGDFLFYADNTFFSGSMSPDEPWALHAADAQTEGRDLGTMRGVFCGEAAQLQRLLADIADGRDHFPRRAYARFRPDLVVDVLPAGSGGGVAVADFDGDGRPDIFAASRSGDRIYMQVQPLRFANATKPLGLESESGTVAMADFDGDGTPDLVLDGAFVQVVKDGRRVRFHRTDLMPAFDGRVLGASAVDFDRDGRPDVVVSVEGVGLRAFRNALGEGKGFAEETAALGLGKKEAGAGGSGLLSAGSLDGKPALFFAADPGYLLVLENGRFQPVPLPETLSFVHGVTGEGAGAGGAAFLHVRDDGPEDLLVAVDSEFLLYRRTSGGMENITRHGGEISEGSFRHIGVVADDFDLGGRVGFYGVARGDNGKNRLILNRGYGKFMWAEMNKAYSHVFQGPAHERGGSGAVSADMDGDGAPDIVLLNDSGHLAVLMNDVISERQPQDHPTQDVLRLQEMRRVIVTASNPAGLHGARLELLDADGRAVRRRALHGGQLPGSAAPPGATLMAPRAGNYTLRVLRGDGTTSDHPVDLTASEEARVDASLR